MGWGLRCVVGWLVGEWGLMINSGIGGCLAERCQTGLCSLDPEVSALVGEGGWVGGNGCSGGNAPLSSVGHC